LEAGAKENDVGSGFIQVKPTPVLMSGLQPEKLGKNKK